MEERCISFGGEFGWLFKAGGWFWGWEVIGLEQRQPPPQPPPPLPQAQGMICVKIRSVWCARRRASASAGRESQD